MYEELKNRFGDTTNGQILCRMAKDMTEIERQFYENLVNEVVFANNLTMTEHAMEKAKQRHLSIGKIRYIYFEGALSEVQFDSSGIKAILSYSTKGQSKKGFSSNIVLDVIEGKVISVWNREHRFDEVKDSYTYTGHKNYIINEHENTFELASKFVSLDCFNEPNKFVKFLRKYRPRFDEHHERKIKQFLEGRTLLCQL